MATGLDVKPIYVHNLAAAIKSLRTGNKLVVHTLRGLGRTPAAIREAVEAVHAKRALVMDAETKRTTKAKKTCEKLIEEAVKALGNERRGRRKKTRAERRMPWDQVRKFYFDPLLSNAELEAAVAKGYYPMTYHTMRRYFGKKRGAQVGRPSKAKKT
ncbi:MAG: hypothetical protein KGL39_55965 [Patescibacteria group bacterium]|nr:hypothetical protein [Patescibacteria group bacterium]